MERIGLGQGKQLPLLFESSVNMHIASFGQASTGHQALTECERAGALHRDLLVLAPLADGSGKRGLARIVDAQFVPAQGKDRNGPVFKYYITYEGENRRMDRWINQEYLCCDAEKVAKASRKREKKLRRKE